MIKIRDPVMPGNRTKNGVAPNALTVNPAIYLKMKAHCGNKRLA